MNNNINQEEKVASVSEKSSSPEKVPEVKRRGRPPLKKGKKGRPRK